MPGTPDFEGALLALLKLLGIIDDSATVQFTWFGDPADASLKSIAGRRDQIGALFSALTGATPSATFPGGMSFSPVTDGDLEAGFVWNSSGFPLHVGFGATTKNPTDSSPAVLARLFSEDAQFHAASEFGKVWANVPSPAFLSAVTVEADALTPDLSLNVTDKRTAAENGPRTRTFDLAKTQSAEWDAMRLALFILQSWIHQNASGLPAADVRSRIDKHLFALLGDLSTGGIQASPLVEGLQPATANMGSKPNFLGWAQSAITTAPASLQNALAFLWHIRALLTGETNYSLLAGPGGSIYIPLVPGSGESPGPPDPNAPKGTYPPGSAGAWIGIAPGASGSFNLVLSMRATGMASPFELTLANAGSAAVSIPPVPAASLNNLKACLNALKTRAISLGSAGKLSADASGTPWTLTLLSQTLPGNDPASFLGDYSLALTFDPNSGKIGFAPTMPAFLLKMPPSGPDIKQAFANLLNWIANLPQVKSTAFGKVAGDLAQLGAEALTPNAKLDPAPLLIDLTTAVLPLPKAQGSPVVFSTRTAKVNNQNDTILTAKVEVGPIDGGSSSSLPIHIGTLGAHVDLNLGSDVANAMPPPARFYGFGFSFSDLRLGDQSSGGSSLIGSLIPDLKKIKGFSLSVDWTAGKSVEISGGGTISIQQTLGPLDINSLTVSLRNNKILKLGIDLTFALGPITVSTEDLGFQIGFTSGGSLPPFLQGLGLSMNTDFIKLSGLFGSMKGDYVGGASVSVAGIFQLSAIGAYTQVQGSPSLFIFASLVAPLGGTPWMFITGVAGGFGLNRNLPPVMPLDQHPFLQVMSGDLKLTGGVSAQLQKLGEAFGPKKNEFWVAGGVQFISFGLIHGKVIVAVAFGNKFSLQLIGAASFSLSPVAYFEIDIAVTVDEEKFLMIASLSPNSYVIDPKLLSLRGDFALGVWHSGDHAGDFVLSIGGYHPYYSKPDYFPSLNRVGVKAHIDLGLTIDISVEGFFALTNQAMMAGASASLAASVAGISAGLDVYVDVFIQWDPFFILADLGVTIWFVFFGRHEIGVELSIHTPTFGGTAKVHLFIVSFSFDFGSPLMQPPPPSITDFTNHNLQAHAIEKNGAANVTALSAGSSKGLFKIVVTQGRAAAEADAGSTSQEGTDSKQPILVDAKRFAIRVATAMPFAPVGQPAQSAGQLVVNGVNNLALCQKFTNYSKLTVTWSANPTSVVAPAPTTTQAMFPAAQFGDGFQPVQGDGARQNVAKSTAGDHRVPLTNAVDLDYSYEPAEPVSYKEGKTDESEGSEILPLPLASKTRPPILYQRAPARLKFAAGAPLATLQVGKTVSASVLAATLSQAKLAPLAVGSSSAQWLRPKAAGPKHTTIKTPAGTAVIAVPTSPARRDELSSISLRVLPLRTASARTASIRQIVLAPGVLSAVAAPPTGGTSITVAGGSAAQFAVSGGPVLSGTLTPSTNHGLRMIVLGYGEKPMSDAPVTGTAAVPLPRGLRSVLLIGEAPAAASAAVGVESHCTLLALGSRIFAGVGCVIDSNVPLAATYHPLDSLPASAVLPALSNATISFGAPPATASLVITIRQSSPGAGPASQNVRWRSITAALGAITMITGAGAMAIVMPVAAAGPWSLELDLGPGWQLSGVVVVPQVAAAAAAALRNSTAWNLVDDRLEPGGGSSSATLEVRQ